MSNSLSQFVIIVGANGTIIVVVQILSGLHDPTSGQVLIDHSSGDYRIKDLYHVTGHVTEILSQDTSLWPVPCRKNWFRLSRFFVQSGYDHKGS